MFKYKDYPSENKKLKNKATNVTQSQNSNFLYTL